MRPSRFRLPPLRHLRVPRWNSELCPALPVVTCSVAGILLTLAVTGGESQLSRVVGSVLAASAALFAAVSARRASLLLCFAAGAGWSAIHVAAPWRTYRGALPRDECRVDVRGVVVDKGYAGDSLAWLHGRSGAVFLIRELRTSSSGGWTRCAGRLLLRSPHERTPAYGTVVRAQGMLVRPRTRLFDGDFDYRHYLRGRGIEHILHANMCEPIPAQRNWRQFPAALFRWRDRCVELLVRGLRTDEDAALLAAMTLGYRQGLDPRTRNTFLRCGAIHIFAISGLHAGIVGTLMLVFLRIVRVPYRARYVLLPVLLGGYVYVTGGAPSAIRAWVMFSLWSLTKAFLMPNSPVNTVALAALVLLFVNPLNLTQTGFQFSFAIVLLLIMGWRFCSPFLTAIDESNYWVPRSSRRARVRTMCRRRLADVVCASTLAWLAGAGLIAWTNSLVIPAALPVNAVISMLVFLCLCAGIAKITFGLLLFAWGEDTMAWGLDMVLRFMRWLAEWGSDWPASVSVMRPPGWLVATYYTLLIVVFLQCLPPRSRLAAACGCWLIVLGIAVGPPCSPARLAMFHGDGNAAPAIVMTRGGGRPAIMVNSGGAGLARCAAAWLRSRGFNELDVFVVTDGAWENIGGADELLAACPARTLVLPAGSTWLTNKLKPLEDSHRARGRRVRVMEATGEDRTAPRVCSTGTTEIESEKLGWNQARFSLLTDDSPGRTRCEWQSDTREGADLVWSSKDGKHQVRLPISLRPTLTTLPD